MELSFCHWEFEQEVRKRVNVFDRAITTEDALSVIELDLINFNFREEDIDALLHFTNLKRLGINLGKQSSFFWDHFQKMEDLYWCCWGDEIDFTSFSNMRHLRWLCVSGGDYSDIAFKKLEALIPLQNLTYLQLHEFGPVDLGPLEKMQQLTSFELRYSDNVKGIDAIGKMSWLKELVLDGLYVENLDFLDALPNNVDLEMSGIKVCGQEKIDVEKWKRFKKHDICEIEVKDKCWTYIDLSALSN